MQYGSVNEDRLPSVFFWSDGNQAPKVALRRFSEFLSTCAPQVDLPVFVDEPGIWVSTDRPYLAGSPDVQAHPIV